MAASLLIVDDDPTLLRFLREYLEREGYAVAAASGGQEALRGFYASRPDLVIVDVMMPGMDGWELTARLRELADTPVIMLTAKTAEADKLRGFRLGVDDYVTKPFSLAELGARVRAVLSRSTPVGGAAVQAFEVGDIKVDLKRREAWLKGELVALTPTEFRVLACLAERPGEAISQDEILRSVWGDYREEGSSALRRYIWFLRKKIEDNPEDPKRIVTVRGFGYRMEP